ncbi:LacI family transcriptional regulator [Haloactinospora alba]|uniref:LacI family transcriptional regulator n=1 Tax=Haloactinospora alba TaxID=405555 RepID=A0A543NIL2_9ACTN|nr:LacI family DNA-binding transcriptional regulator [Haloactinospora alba]TQN31590.1 LacI family transcriptional regulator [Haloactinospora alba]
MATIKDVARAAGVSTATVSRVLNNHGSVTTEARDRVNEAVRTLGYHPNSAARTLRSHEVSTLGLVIGDVLNPFFAELARAVEDEAREHGYYVIIGNADENPQCQDEYLDILLDRRVAGLLMCPTAEVSPRVGEAVRNGHSLVFLDRTIPELDIPTVRSENAQAVHELVRHLCSVGHHRIAIISGPDSLVTGQERLAAFREALRDNGCELPAEYLRIGDFQVESGVQAMRSLMELPAPPTAVFAADNLMALGALRSIRDQGLRISTDVGIASFDDLPWFELVDPPITAVQQRTEEIGRVAVRELIASLHGEQARSWKFPCRFVPRQSCGERHP